VHDLHINVTPADALPVRLPQDNGGGHGGLIGKHARRELNWRELELVIHIENGWARPVHLDIPQHHAA
jgi:hypothetical protein